MVDQRDQAGADRAEEGEYHQQHEAGGDEHGHHDLINRGLHRAGRVERHVDRHAGRCHFPQIRQHCLRRLADVERIGGGLRHQSDRDRRLAAVTKAGHVWSGPTTAWPTSDSRIRNPSLPRRSAKPLNSAPSFSAVSTSTEIEFVLAPDLAAWRLDVLLRQRDFHVVHGHAIGRHPHRIELQADGIFAVTDKLRLRDAGDRRSSRGTISSLHERGHRHVALPGIGEREVQHRLTVRADLRDDRRDGARRQLGLRGGTFARTSFTAADGSTPARKFTWMVLSPSWLLEVIVSMPVAAPDRRLELRSDLALNQFRIGARESRYDGDAGSTRRGNWRICRSLHRPQAQDRQDQVDNDGKDRPLDTEIGQPHQVALFASACGAGTILTVSPSRSRNWPTVTTCSPACHAGQKLHPAAHPSGRRVTGARCAMSLASTTNT